jgi:rubrerythrin
MRNKGDLMTEKECKHRKVYASLTTNPPILPWICSVCGYQGQDIEIFYNKPEYDDLMKKFHPKEKP